MLALAQVACASAANPELKGCGRIRGWCGGDGGTVEDKTCHLQSEGLRGKGAKGGGGGAMDERPRGRGGGGMRGYLNHELTTEGLRQQSYSPGL